LEYTIMTWYSDLRTRQKLYLGFGIIVALLLCLILFENYQDAGAKTEYERILGVHVPLLQSANALLEEQLRERIVFRDVMEFESGNGRPEDFTLARDRFFTQEKKVQAAMTRLRGVLLGGNSRGEQDAPQLTNMMKSLASIERNHEAFAAAAMSAIEMIEKSDPGGLRGAQLQLGQNEIDFQSTSDMLRFDLRTLVESAGQRISTRAENATLGSVIIFSVGLLVVLGLVSTISRQIAGPLTLATEVAERLGQGDTSLPVETIRKDEVGELLRTLEKLRCNSDHAAQVAARIADGDLTVTMTPLSDKDVLGKALASMVDRLRTQIREMMEGINVLATATAELSATMARIGTGARETAASVTQTASTLMEVKQASQLSNEKASVISDNAQHTLHISREGSESIEKSIQSMHNIREQMRGIAESIVKLSEQGQAIGEIVTSVNDLAEQSNILAVNAAIEAAKAGEYGKGFTVVAKEIRNHAEQSKQATSRVRSILIDTQKATSSAVMVAERGTKLAEEGAQLSGESGDAIRTVMRGIGETAQSMLQISASTREQLIGLDQVTTAIHHIRTASEQNAESIHQVELTARNLQELGSRLQQFVERYQLS
jgi:methyl-accepting chemotaxis protein